MKVKVERNENSQTITWVGPVPKPVQVRIVPNGFSKEGMIRIGNQLVFGTTVTVQSTEKPVGPDSPTDR
jgi:hypothetical protein